MLGMTSLDVEVERILRSIHLGTPISGGRTTTTTVRHPDHIKVQKEIVNFYGECQAVDCPYADWGGITYEAAHIVAVEDGGEADVDNVLCFCPSHHKMFDDGIAVDIWWTEPHNPQRFLDKL